MTVQYDEAVQTNTTFNGWANRSTWVTVLWLTNEESTYEDLRTIARHPEHVDWEKEQALKDYLFDLLLGEDSPIMDGIHQILHLNYGRHSFASGWITDLVGQELSKLDYQAIIESVED